jgi:glycosyltransferase involved in cell wall biosynthesis
MSNESLSIVFPVYNEAEVLPLLKSEVERHFNKRPGNVEFLFVDDGSTDASLKLLEEWGKNDPRVRVISFSANQGHQQAIKEGMLRSSGDWVVTMDSDLQDPLGTVDSMLAKTSEGYDIIHAQRITRQGESLHRKISAWMYYRIVKFFFVSDLMLDVGDFRLMSRQSVKEYFNGFARTNLIRADIPRLKFKQCAIPYHRQKRAAGKSKFTLGKLIDLAMSFSRKSKS